MKFVPEDGSCVKFKSPNSKPSYLGLGPKLEELNELNVIKCKYSAGRACDVLFGFNFSLVCPTIWPLGANCGLFVPVNWAILSFIM